MQSTLSWSKLAMALDEKNADRVQPDTAVSRDSAQRASVAQALLVARLKARNRRDLAMDTLERGAHVMWVTCKSWFSSGQPPASVPEEDAGKDHHKDTDAHRDH
jgi:hypothetical protein